MGATPHTSESKPHIPFFQKRNSKFCTGTFGICEVMTGMGNVVTDRIRTGIMNIIGKSDLFVRRTRLGLRATERVTPFRGLTRVVRKILVSAVPW